MDVDADFDPLTGLLTWTFTSIDPTTLGIPVGNVEEGFLPPDTTPPEGEGFISYVVDPKSTDTTGTVIDAQGTVIFQAGLPDQSSLNTPEISNTIDDGPPTSSVSGAAGLSPATFTVNWSGQDDPGGSGIAHYNVYVSDDDGPFTLWQSNTTQTSATYTGQNGHTYGFYSVATDNVGNQQPTPVGRSGDDGGGRHSPDQHRRATAAGVAGQASGFPGRAATTPAARVSRASAYSCRSTAVPLRPG